MKSVERVKEFIGKARELAGKAAPIAGRLVAAGGLTLATVSAGSEVARADSEVGLVPQGITQVMVPLNELTAVVIRTQSLGVAGQYLSVDPANHPDSVEVVGFIANKQVMIPVTAYPNMAFGIHISDIKANSHQERLAELYRVTQEQAIRSFNPGECGLPTGCNNVRVFGFAVNQLDNGVQAFEPAGNRLVTKDQGVAVAPGVTPPEVAPAPIYPDNISQVVSRFGGDADKWDRLPSGAWHFYSPNQERVLFLNGFIMDGYNGNGPFVAGGSVQVAAFGGTLWPVSGPAELEKLRQAVQANNPGRQIQVIWSQ